LVFLMPDACLRPIHIQAAMIRSLEGDTGRYIGGGRFGDERNGGRHSNFSTLVDCVQGRYRSWVEPFALDGVNDAQSVSGVVCLLIRAVCGESIERICDRNDARENWDLVVLESMRISAAIQRFMM